MGTVPIFSSPLLHFLVLGGALYAAQLALPDDWSPFPESIAVAESDLQAMRQDWIRSSGRPPTPAELQASVLQFLGDEALFREALRRGLDRDDPVVNDRLLRNLRFADPQRAGDPEELRRAARAMGMVRSDLVIRRRLVQRLEQALVGELRLGEAELREYVAAHPRRYARAARFAFDNVFIASDRPDAAARAQELLARLRSGDAGAANAGDAFALAAPQAAQSYEEVARRMGPEVADALAGATVGAWTSPVASAWGWHLLRVNRRLPAADADFAAVREAAARALHAELRQDVLRKERARLAARYQVELPAGVALDLP